MDTPILSGQTSEEKKCKDCGAAMTRVITGFVLGSPRKLWEWRCQCGSYVLGGTCNAGEFPTIFE